MICRDYHNFQNDKFREELENEVLKCDLNNIEYQYFLNFFTEVSTKQVPLKKKYLRANQRRVMTKDLYKATMNHSRLRNTFLSDKTETLRKEYKKQRNFCRNLLRKAKKRSFH